MAALDGALDPISGHRAAGVDPYGPNPLLEILRVTTSVVPMALEGGPAPTMFFGGSLPPFTASGIDPEILMRFPWGQRHWAAAEPDQGAVYAALTEYSDTPDVVLPCDGYNTFLGAMRHWAINSKKTVKPELDDNAFYESLFGNNDTAAR